MKQIIVLLAALGVLSLTACFEKKGVSASLKTDDDKLVYAIGYDMGGKMKTLNLSDNEVAILQMGIADGAKSKKAQAEPREHLPKVGEFLRGRQKAFADKEKEAGTKFLEDAKKKEGAETAESGLIFISTEAGSGDNPKASDRVKVNYHGTLRDGTVFDSTRERKQPASFRLDRVIPCWKEGVQKIKVGGKAELYCPPAIAYGDRGAPPKIPPGAALKFEVELLEIIKEEPKKGKGK